MSTDAIPFNRPHMTGKELYYISQAHVGGRLAGGGPFTERCQMWIEQRTGCSRALLTHSCTAALEMTAMLLELEPGDEVVLPSYTSVSTANAFVLCGGVPVFVDVRGDTLNLDERLIEDAITDRTRAVVPVHYAGVACEMDAIVDIARRHDLKIIEDAAQGVMASYRERPLGSIGHLGTYSFHETENLIAGEGGSLLINSAQYAARAEVICEKGTDQSRFARGEVDRYTWQDKGSSFLPGELISAFLWAQLEEADRITSSRLEIWQRYHEMLEPLASAGALRRPVVPKHCQHNGHMYYILLSSGAERELVLEAFQRHGIGALFHYVPLHSSPAGIRYGRTHGDLRITDSVAERLIRLPMWIELTEGQQHRVVEVLTTVLKEKARGATSDEA